MTEDLNRLLESFIFSHFGTATGQVASILLSRGSLPFPHLLRLSSLPPPTLQSTLLSLSLHCLLYHTESEQNGKIVELYEINKEAVMERMRIGMYVSMAVESRGEAMRGVLKGLWMGGMRTAEELAKEVGDGLWKEQEKFASSTALTNGKGKEKARLSSPADAQKVALRTISQALQESFIAVVTPGSQLSPSSLDIKWEEELKLSIKGIPSAKDLKELKLKLSMKRDEWRTAERKRAQGRLFVSGEEDDDDAPRRRPKKKKRRRRVDSDVDEDDLDAETSFGMEVDAPEEEEEVFFPLPKGAFYKIHTEKFHIKWRSQIIGEFAEKRYNKEVVFVLKLFLKLAERSCDTMDAELSAPVSLQDLYSAYKSHPSPPPLSHCFSPRSPDPSWVLPTKPSELLKEICDVLSCADNRGILQTGAFLQPSGANRWHVEWNRVGEMIRLHLVESLVEGKVGKEGVRCWRILKAKGKLDEKHLARLAFLSVKDAREVIGRLSSSHYIESQEVPRSADRAPSRTFFLWYVDYSKVLASLLAHHYKALANLQAQKSEQIELRKTLVEKSERTDVRERKDALLTMADKDALKEFEMVMEALTVAEMRIDKDLFVLKDLDPIR